MNIFSQRFGHAYQMSTVNACLLWYPRHGLNLLFYVFVYTRYVMLNKFNVHQKSTKVSNYRLNIKRKHVFYSNTIQRNVNKLKKLNRILSLIIILIRFVDIQLMLGWWRLWIPWRWMLIWWMHGRRWRHARWSPGNSMCNGRYQDEYMILQQEHPCTTELLHPPSQ